jgi:hypothetical protein
MTTKGGSGGMVDLEAKFLRHFPDHVDVFIPGSGKVTIPEALETLRQWASAQTGDKITIRVPMDFASRKNLLFGSGGTVGTARPQPPGLLHG